MYAPYGDPIKTRKVFEVIWTEGVPQEVKEEVAQLWRDMEFGNDNYYYEWNSDEDGEEYPLIDKFLRERGVLTGLIHYWW